MHKNKASIVHGTFGEILQGYTAGAQGFEHFLFTAPVEELRCSARLKREESAARGPSITPPDRTKALAAFRSLSAELGLSHTDATIDIVSNIPVAKGHASSTADILAVALLCIRDGYPEAPPPMVHALALSVARRLEYGDYLLHPGIAACAQRSQTLIRKYHTDLRWSIVGVDEGGRVDTEAFHRELPEDPGKARVYERLFGELDAALLANDGRTAAEIATHSSELHNDRLPKKSLVHLMAVKEEWGALGVCVAHSGTLAGLIFSKHQTDHDLRVAGSRRALRSLGYDSSLYTLKESVPS
ncbi:GHMP family kinase ATP-binding protein [Streptomyces sudanensis]|uniref:GHMP family kinase ATP-binding protein n=1 Tax=Streptomyces sudanensis TaxID=436397 RepID=UPI003FD8E579